MEFFEFFGWLLRTSAEAAVITLLILAAQFCLRKRLDARSRHLLWLLVLVRLAMPASLPSPISLFNFLRIEPATLSSIGHRQQPTPPASVIPVESRLAPAPALPVTSTMVEHKLAQPAERTPVFKPSMPQTPPQAAHGITSKWPLILALVWLTGVIILVLRAAVQNILFCRLLSFGERVGDPKILEILRDCKSLVGVRAAVTLIETSAVRSPALYGLLRPGLLVPPGLMAGFSATELRHVLLHELAHVRRRDMLLQWLVAFFQIIHWFNPVLWFGFRRMAMDRELACDDLALSVAGEKDSRAYGQTIIKLLEGCSQPPALPALVGILEDKAQMLQRIAMIARFKQRSRWSFAGIAVAVALALATLTGAQTKSAVEKPGALLTGVVQFTNGQPAAATVFIYTAAPREGSTPICPSCFPDCDKSARTDRQGRFEIESLDPQLLFRLLVAGKDSKPEFVAGVDPANGPIRITIQPQNLAHIPQDQIIRGRIVDDKGTPIRWATVESRSVVFQNLSSGNPSSDIDRLAVSDNHGDFVLTARRPLVSLSLVVDAPGYAKRTFENVLPGKARNFHLTVGAMIKGRLTLHGKPVPGASVGIISADRSIDGFVGPYQVATDANGVFLFRNLPPNVSYQVFGLAKTLHALGATKAIEVNAGSDGTVTDAGYLLVGPAFHIIGHVVLADGRRVPAKSKISIGRYPGGEDLQLADLGPNGAFDFDGIPQGVVSIAPRIVGYRLSVKNRSLDSLNPDRLLGRVNQNITGLVILMEKGRPFESYFDNTANGMDLPENRSLTGAEDANDHSMDRMISGRVTDKDAGVPVAAFRITPGRSSFRGINWNPQRAVDGTNGFYLIYLPKDAGPAELMVEASGYLPVASTELPLYETNFDFAMSKGSGPSGVVLLPDGQPAAGASVALVRSMGQSSEVQLDRRGKFVSFRDPKLLVAADVSGHFNLLPQLGMTAVAACAPEGFQIESLESLATNGHITLEPWGKVKGTIRRGGHPSAMETLYLSFGGSLSSESLGMFIPTITDDNGNFTFDFAPPVDCQIYAETPTEDMPARLTSEKEFHVQPGKTAKLAIDASEKPIVDLNRARERIVSYSEVPKQSLQGFVFLPNGKPAADTEVGIADQEHELRIGDGDLVAGPLNPNVARTAHNGSFSVPWPSAGTRLFIANTEGVADLSIGDVTNGIKIVLKPWARVKGTMRLNHRAAPGLQIHLHQIDNMVGWDGFHVDATTDPGGHFFFAHVLPGQCGLGRWIELGHGARSTSDILQFDLAPGESTNIICGGDGRPVTGKLDLTLGKGVPADADLAVNIHTDLPFLPHASGNMSSLTIGEIRRRRQSAQGKQARAAFRSYVGHVAADGSFQVDDVPPGSYQISIDGYVWNAQGPNSRIQGIPGITHIVVPPLTDPDKCEPYDLGRIKVTATVSRLNTWMNHSAVTNSLKVGDTAPPFETRAHDGKPLRLADYRGKFVLLDFRIMLPGNEMDALQSVNDAFGKDDRFVMISLCATVDDAYLKRIKDKVPTHWIVGDLDFGHLTKSYGLNGASFPLILLVGPDGKIVASHLHGDSIYAAVAQALKPK